MTTTNDEAAKAFGLPWRAGYVQTVNDHPIESPQDVADAMGVSALKGRGGTLFGVFCSVNDEDGLPLVVCYTGNGPNSEKHAHLIASLAGQNVGREQAVRDAFKDGWLYGIDEIDLRFRNVEAAYTHYLSTQQEKPGSDPNRCPKCGVAGWIDTSPIWKDQRRWDYSQMIENLERELQDAMLRVSEIKKTINQLCFLSGAGAKYQDVEAEFPAVVSSVQARQFVGKSMLETVKEIMRIRGKKPGTAQEILDEMRKGDFGFPSEWKPKLYLKNLSIFIGSSKQDFIWFDTKDGKAYALAEHYPERKRELLRQTKEKPGGATISEQDLPVETVGKN